MALKGKTALLFGAGVIARGYAQLLVKAGAGLVLVSGGETAGRLAQDLATGEGDRIMALKADVADPGQVRKALEAARALSGRVEIVINGAGGATPQATAATLEELLAMKPEAFSRMMEVNFLGKWHSLQAYAAYLKEAGHQGSVVNITSMSGLIPLSRAVAYSAAFAAVENLTRSMAFVYGHYSLGRVNNLAVGFTCGDQNRRLLYNPDGSLTKRGEEIVANTSQHRFLTPEEIAPHVLHLADEETSAAINGLTFRVDGGYGLIGLAGTGWS